MRPLSTSRFARTLGVLVVLAAWFVVSNQCALSMIVGACGGGSVAKGQHSCCAPEPGGAGDDKSGGKLCCQPLRVLPVEASAKLVKFHETVPLFELAWEFVGGLDLDAPNLATLPAIGPPESRSFAEVVLHRSLRSHAPPVAA